MIHEDLKEDFSNMQSLAWESDYELDKLKYKFEVERHVNIWNEMAEFMGYGILIVPNLSRFVPIYFDRKFPNGETYSENKEGLFCDIKDYDAFTDWIRKEYIKKYRIPEWMPTLDFNHAKECESKLMKEGNYSKINLSKSFTDLESEKTRTKIIYSGSITSKNVLGEGKNELEAICNACTNFTDRKRGRQLELFDTNKLVDKIYVLS